MKQKKPQNIDDFLAQMGISKKELYEQKYRKSLTDARASKAEAATIKNLNIRTGYYSMRYRVKENPWVKSRPASKAHSWLFKTVFANPKTYRYSRRIMFQGGMFTFQYFNPKYKNNLSVLPWFDKFPLVISLGPKVTNLGVRNIGFNMHLLPPKIRIVVMCAIFELHKKMYRYQIFMKQDKPVDINYQTIINNLSRFGVEFCVRMYIPARMKQVVRFPYKDWHKAIFIPSRGYNGIRAAKLIKEWRDFNKKNGNFVSPNLDWKTNI